MSFSGTFFRFISSCITFWISFRVKNVIGFVICGGSYIALSISVWKVPFCGSSFGFEVFWAFVSFFITLCLSLVCFCVWWDVMCRFSLLFGCFPGWTVRVSCRRKALKVCLKCFFSDSFYWSLVVCLYLYLSSERRPVCDLRLSFLFLQFCPRLPMRTPDVF